MDISCLKNEFTMNLYENTVSYTLFITQYLEYTFDVISYILETLATLLLTLLLGLSFCFHKIMFYVWEEYMKYTLRKFNTEEGVRYNILFEKDLKNGIGNIYLFNNLKSASQMNMIENSYHFNMVLSGSYHEYYKMKGTSNTSKWMRIRRSIGNIKYENNYQNYKIEHVENEKNEPWILSLQINCGKCLPFFNNKNDKENDTTNYFEFDENYKPIEVAENAESEVIG